MRVVLYSPALGSSGELARRHDLLAQALQAGGIEVAQRDPESWREALGAGDPVSGLDAWMCHAPSALAGDDIGPALRRLGVPYWVIDPAAELAEEALEAATAVVATSHAAAETARRVLPDTQPVVRLPRFVDVAPVMAAARVRAQYAAAVQSRLGLDSRAPRLLTTASTEGSEAVQSYGLLARALSRNTLLDWHLVVAPGGALDRDIPKAFSALPHHRFHWLSEVSESERIALMLGCDLFVWPALPGVSGGDDLLRAQAASLPVVAFSDPAVAELVADGRGGRLVKSGNAEALANVISFLLRQPAVMRSMGGQAREYVEGEHSLRRAGEVLRALLAGPANELGAGHRE